MKNEFHIEIEKHERLHLRKVEKKDFAGVFGHAYLRAFTTKTVKATFVATGLCPYNSDVIMEKQMKPSLLH